MKFKNLYNLIDKYEIDEVAKNKKREILDGLVIEHEMDMDDIIQRHYMNVQEAAVTCKISPLEVDEMLIQMYKYPEVLVEHNKNVTFFLIGEKTHSKCCTRCVCINCECNENTKCNDPESNSESDDEMEVPRDQETDEENDKQKELMEHHEENLCNDVDSKIEVELKEKVLSRLTSIDLTLTMNLFCSGVTMITSVLMMLIIMKDNF